MREKNNALLMIHFNFSDNFRLYSAENILLYKIEGETKNEIFSKEKTRKTVDLNARDKFTINSGIVRG